MILFSSIINTEGGAFGPKVSQREGKVRDFLAVGTVNRSRECWKNDHSSLGLAPHVLRISALINAGGLGFDSCWPLTQRFPLCQLLTPAGSQWSQICVSLTCRSQEIPNHAYLAYMSCYLRPPRFMVIPALLYASFTFVSFPLSSSSVLYNSIQFCF